MGELYWDDGDSVINNITTYNYYHFQFNFNVQATSAIFNITMDKKATNLPLKSLDNIEIFGYPYTPNLSTAKLNGNPITINTQTSSYSPFTKVLNITTTNFIDLNNNGPTWILTWNNS
uniref:Uncharacterized protein n=1 Tax=Acrobeloides nanus TaxID=290746 RepID=A0A914E020_9BILA